VAEGRAAYRRSRAGTAPGRPRAREQILEERREVPGGNGTTSERTRPAGAVHGPAALGPQPGFEPIPPHDEPLTDLDGSSVRLDDGRPSVLPHEPTATSGPLIVVAYEDATERAFRDFEAWLTRAQHRGQLLSLAGQLRIVFAPPKPANVPRVTLVPEDDPELRAWSGSLAVRYPWLPAWVEPGTGLAGTLIAAALPSTVTDPSYPAHFIAAAVRSANYAVAFTRRLGGARLDHVYEFLAEFEITDLHPGFFAGVDSLADELDASGRHRAAP
jgi:hypothetical protein